MSDAVEQLRNLAAEAHQLSLEVSDLAERLRVAEAERDRLLAAGRNACSVFDEWWFVCDPDTGLHTDVALTNKLTRAMIDLLEVVASEETTDG